MLLDLYQVNGFPQFSNLTKFSFSLFKSREFNFIVELLFHFFEQGSSLLFDEFKSLLNSLFAIIRLRLKVFNLLKFPNLVLFLHF